MKASETRLLNTILNCPTAPYREHYVQAAIERWADKLELRRQRDRYGNLYVSYRQGRARPLAFSAHLDHPGFELIEGGRRPRARLLGGVAPSMLRGAPVAFYADSPDTRRTPPRKPPQPVSARITTVETQEVPGARRPAVFIDAKADGDVPLEGFGHFDFPGLELQDDVLYSRALDNLLSCVLIMSTLATLRRRGDDANVMGVFTRAEEVGFVGAGGVLRSSILRPSRPLVVLECSKAQGEVRMGYGPVLRVGDAMTCFDPELDLWLSDRAASATQSKSRFRFQRALMTGGSCEASLFMLHGRRVGALAIPLGNYHNMTAENSIGPEFIDVRDYDNALHLMQHLATQPPDPKVRRSRRAQLDRLFAQSESQLDVT